MFLCLDTIQAALMCHSRHSDIKRTPLIYFLARVLTFGLLLQRVSSDDTLLADRKRTTDTRGHDAVKPFMKTWPREKMDFALIQKRELAPNHKSAVGKVVQLLKTDQTPLISETNDPRMKEGPRMQRVRFLKPIPASRTVNRTSYYAKCKSMLCRHFAQRNDTSRMIYRCLIPTSFHNVSSGRVFLNKNCTQFHLLCHCATLMNLHSKLNLCELYNSSTPHQSVKVVERQEHAHTGRDAAMGSMNVKELLKVCDNGASFRANRVKRDIRWLFLKNIIDLVMHRHHEKDNELSADRTSMENSGFPSEVVPSVSRDTSSEKNTYKTLLNLEKILQSNGKIQEKKSQTFGRISEKDRENHIIHSLRQSFDDEVPFTIKSISQLWRTLNIDDIQSIFNHVLNKQSLVRNNSTRKFPVDLPHTAASNVGPKIPKTAQLTLQEGNDDDIYVSLRIPELYSHSHKDVDPGRPVVDKEEGEEEEEEEEEEKADSLQLKPRFVSGPSIPLSNKTDFGDVSITSPQGKRTHLADDRHLHESSSETCRHHLETRLVALPGCIPKTIMITFCQGTCHSRSVPRWSDADREVDLVAHCTCCAPNSIVFRNIVFRCPRRRPRVMSKRIGLPFQCSCRPCSVTPEVEAEEPY